MLYHKLQGFQLRISDAIRWFFLRLQRLGKHLLGFCWSSGSWWLELSYLVLDVFAVPEIYETIIDVVKWNTRVLSEQEIDLLFPIFGDSINYKRVRIDERAYVGPRQKNFCYVSFYTVNSWGKMHPALLIHEITHVWQFQQMGSVYIPKALSAQGSKEGYNYGGATRISYWALQNGEITDFNLEQQADIVADFWRLKNGLSLHWGPAGPGDLPHYAYLVKQLKEINK